MNLGNLCAISRAAATFAASDTSNQVLCFQYAASFFEAFEAWTTTSLIKKLRALHVDQFDGILEADEVLKVSDLLGALRALVHLLRVSRANQAMGDIQKVMGEFERFESWPLREFLKRLNMLLTMPPAKAKIKNTTDIAEDYITALQVAEGNSHRFQEIVDRLQNDRQIKKADLAKIMTAYTGLPAGKRTKPAMISEIKSTFAAEALQSGNVSSLRAQG